VHSDDVANSSPRCTPGVAGRSHGGNIAAHDSSRVAATRFLVTYELDLCCFDHCIGRFHHGRETPALDHS
jgi:hypothetical protein